MALPGATPQPGQGHCRVWRNGNTERVRGYGAGRVATVLGAWLLPLREHPHQERTGIHCPIRRHGKTEVVTVELDRLRVID